MKKISAVILSVLVLLSAVCLAGCGKKTSISSDKFCSIMSGRGYRLEDTSERFADTDDVVSAVTAFYDNDQMQIEFIVLESPEVARSSYRGNKARMEDNLPNPYAKSSVSLFNYDRFVLSGGGYYQVLSRIDDTFIYIVADSDYKDEIKSALEELGY